MASSTTRPTSQEGFAIRKLVWVGPLTILVAVLFNLVLRTIAVAFFGVSAGFTYLQAPFQSSLKFSFTNGTVFDLLSVDLAGYSTVVPDTTIHIVGYRDDGSTVTTNVERHGTSFQT